MRRPRISVPISVSSVLIALTITLTIGWQILVAREFRALAEGFTAIHWVLVVIGSLFFCAIITASLLLTVWLVREIRTNQRQQAFVDAVTHELQTPLASLRLSLETLEKPDLAEAGRHEFLGIMRDEVARLELLVDHVLRAARTDPQHRPRAAVDLVPLLRACADELTARHALASDRVRLLLPERAWVRGDAEQLRVVFRNLLENAIRHARSQAPVEVTLSSAGARELEVSVRDHGVGIPRAALRRIFQPFHQVGPGGGARGSLGLGLSIVRNIVRTHGGSVRARSEGPGRGSRFVVRLPGSAA